MPKRKASSSSNETTVAKKTFDGKRYTLGQARERIMASDSSGDESVETESDEDVPTASMAAHVSDTRDVSIDDGIDGWSERPGGATGNNRCVVCREKTARFVRSNPAAAKKDNPYKNTKTVSLFIVWHILVHS